MLWVIFVALILVLLGYVIFAPFYLEIDTRVGLFRLRWHRLAQAQVRMTDHSLTLEIRVVGWKKNTDLLLQRPHTEKKIKKKNHRKMPLQKIKAMIGSFRINEFNASLSFDDMAWNGVLYPFCRLLAMKTKKNIAINFQGENEIVVEAENNLYRLMKAYATSK